MCFQRIVCSPWTQRKEDREAEFVKKAARACGLSEGGAYMHWLRLLVTAGFFKDKLFSFLCFSAVRYKGGGGGVCLLTTHTHTHTCTCP